MFIHQNIENIVLILQSYSLAPDNASKKLKHSCISNGVSMLTMTVSLSSSAEHVLTVNVEFYRHSTFSLPYICTSRDVVSLYDQFSTEYFLHCSTIQLTSVIGLNLRPSLAGSTGSGLSGLSSKIQLHPSSQRSVRKRHNLIQISTNIQGGMIWT